MTVKEGDNKNLNIQDNRLVLSIDHNGKIVFFNKECEKIAGYNKNEALDKNIIDFLIPEGHRDEWWKILDSAKQEQFVSNIELPWVTKEGDEVIASWAIAQVGESDGRIGNIGLVGEIMPNTKKNEEGELVYNEEVDDSEDYTEELIERTVNEKKENIVLFQFKDKKLVFRKKPSEQKEKKYVDEGEKIDKIDQQIVKIEYDKPAESSKDSNSIETIEKSEKQVNTRRDGSTEVLFKKYDHKNLVKNYERYNKNVQYYEKLEEENKELKEENHDLKADLKSVRIKFTNVQKKLEELEKEHNDLAEKNIDLFRNSVYFLFDVIGGKKKKEEFDKMINELEGRKAALLNIGDQLNKDKRDINKNRKEFVEWREKLETIEEEIEKRNEKIAKKEEKVRKNLSFFIDENCDDESKEALEKIVISDEIDENAEHHDILDKIPQSAAIIQRGILKQVNDSFIDLLGYDVDLILEKNLFDFVIPEGFSGIEEYYLKRLKGEDITSYETMFITKDDSKIGVEVSTKPVFFRDEKAEIAIFKKIDEGQGGTVAVSVDDVLEKQVEEEKIGLSEESQAEINDIGNKTESEDEEGVSSASDIGVKSEDVVSGEVKSDESAPVGDVVDEDAKHDEVKSDGDDVRSENDAPATGDEVNQAEIDAMAAKANEEPAKDTTLDDKTPENSEKPENTDKSKDENEKKPDDDKEEYDAIVKKLKLKSG